jgi:ferrous iron transport protein A
MARSLTELRIGESATVSTVEMIDEIGLRIMEMGLVPGTSVRFEGAAPLGDPLLYFVRGYRLSLRKSEAERIQVSP